MAKTYKIPITWTMTGIYEIEADSLREARRQAKMTSDFPEVQEYLPDSTRIGSIEEVRELNNITDE